MENDVHTWSAIIEPLSMSNLKMISLLLSLALAMDVLSVYVDEHIIERAVSDVMLKCVISY